MGRLDPLHFRRELRKQQTKAERKLWTILRDRRLASLKFRRQHPLQGYIVDFYCHRARLALELDGSVHDDPARASYDAERQRRIEASGVTVLRFANADAFEQPEATVAAILGAAASHALPHPVPLPEGEGTS
ncbi:endonuclease domain-containing protein [Rubricoccus marinus]|uniref:DUF559 domain-containing protein n=1 Tax=Rubricoccus marinus TaxID=716817 RepID=A0A259TVY4_9BACT|nr:endonuclease domain-containing protein [Rubricoccus marinus]OZC01929.1 hypothetical protein BSZ36_02355 [Rubricoccus marinus]